MALPCTPTPVDKPQTSVHSIAREYTDDPAFNDDFIGDWGDAIEHNVFEYNYNSTPSTPPIHVPQSQSTPVVDSMSAVWITNQMTKTPTSLRCPWCGTINALFEVQCQRCFNSLSSAKVLEVEEEVEDEVDDEESDHATCSQLFMGIMGRTHRERFLVVAWYVRTNHRDVPSDIVNILSSFCTPQFGWCPHPLSRQHFAITNGQDSTWSLCRRRDDDAQISNNIWRNIFWAHEVYLCELRQFKWTLQLDPGYKNASITVGFVEANGTEYSVGSNFAEYDDGYGKLVTTEGIITVCLQWTRQRGSWKCEFLVNGEAAHEMDPRGKYKLAVAMDHNGAAVKCISYDERE